MNKKALLWLLCYFIFICSAHAQSKPPNVLLIIVDDLGYSDLASYGNATIQTPNIDALGKRGVRFTQAYVTSPICAPSRMAIITGRYQQRFGAEFMLYDHFAPSVKKNIKRRLLSLRKKPEGITTLKPDLLLNHSKYATDIPATEITIAQVLKQRGYATGYVGKWNLSTSPEVFPDQHGFDYNYSFDGALTRYVDNTYECGEYISMRLPWAFSDIPAWAPRDGSTAIKEGRMIVTDTGYLTFSFAQKAIDFIERKKSNPFFLTLSFNAPHDPFQVPKSYFDRIKGITDSVKRLYFGMIEALDDAVGMVMRKLQQDDLLNNTLVFFISDNGGATYTRATDNAPLLGGKCTHFEGGLSVPFFIQWPDALEGGKVYDQAVSSLDIFSTAAKACGATLASDRSYDGVNLIPHLQSDTLPPHIFFFWRNGYSKAFRMGDWKLYLNEKQKITRLYNIATDREEKIDQAISHPGKLKELKDELISWEQENAIPPRWPSAADLLINVNGKWFRFPS